jgi:hypothetical protein
VVDSGLDDRFGAELLRRCDLRVMPGGAPLHERDRSGNEDENRGRERGAGARRPAGRAVAEPGARTRVCSPSGRTAPHGLRRRPVGAAARRARTEPDRAR